MTANKHTVQKFMDALSKSNRADVLSCLTDDAEWVVPGVFHEKGKDAFDKQIKSEGLVSCTITVTRMTEENNVVIAEGSVQLARMDGGLLNTVFCDVFVLQDTKIKHLTAYLMEVKK
jgi:ketosteroid isomerase-like protein